MLDIYEIKKAIECGKVKIVPVLVEKALDEGTTANDILSLMINAMGVVGEKFTNGDLFVPEMLVAAKAMSKGVEVLKPYLSGDVSISKGKCIIGTVAGDVHDIGKNLVTMMLESAGFDVVDLGVDVPKENFIEAMKGIDIVCCSALLTTTMPALKETVEAIKADDPTKKVLVGGAPIKQKFADQIGADGYAADAAGAVVIAKELIG